MLKVRKFLLPLTFLAAVLVGALIWWRSFSISPYVYKLPIVAEDKSFAKNIAALNLKLQSSPDDVETLNELAELHYVRARTTGEVEDILQTEKLATRSLKLQSVNNVRAKISLAHAYSYQHRFQEAIDLASAVLKESANSVTAFTVFIPAELAIGDLQKAQQFADTLVIRSPRAGHLALRGLALLSAGRTTEGVFELDRAIHFEDLGEQADSTWARCILARHFMSRDRLKEAETLLSEALRISPRYALALDMKAQLEAKRGDMQAADNDFDEAFTVARQITFLRHGAELAEYRGDHQLALDRWAQAEKFIRQEIRSDLYGHKLELARILLRRATGEDIHEALKLSLEESQLRHSADALYVLAQSYVANQMWSQALASTLEILNQGAREPEFYTLAGLVYQNLGNTDRSQFYRDLAKELDPHFDANLRFK